MAADPHSTTRPIARFDLGVLHRDDREIGVRESLPLSGGCIGVALAFGAWVWWWRGAQSGMACDTGFMIEKSLSMDKVFAIALIFSFFASPRQVRHRVPFRGILVVTGTKMWPTRGQPAVRGPAV